MHAHTHTHTPVLFVWTQPHILRSLAEAPVTSPGQHCWDLSPEALQPEVRAPVCKGQFIIHGIHADAVAPALPSCLDICALTFSVQHNAAVTRWHGPPRTPSLSSINIHVPLSQDLKGSSQPTVTCLPPSVINGRAPPLLPKVLPLFHFLNQGTFLSVHHGRGLTAMSLMRSPNLPTWHRKSMSRFVYHGE